MPRTAAAFIAARIVVLLSLPAPAGAAVLIQSSPGAPSPHAAFAPTSTLGISGDGIPDMVHNPTTGDVTFRTDGAAILTSVGGPSFVVALHLTSAGQILTGNLSPAMNATIGLNNFPYELFGAILNSPGFNDNFDLGDILPAGKSPAQLTSDLTLAYSVLNSGPPDERPATLIVAPEPSTPAVVVVMSLSALFVRRARAKRCRMPWAGTPACA